MRPGPVLAGKALQEAGPVIVPDGGHGFSAHLHDGCGR